MLYQRIRSKISYKELHSLSDHKQKIENLMNIVMHLRKVCNHPDLFELRDARIPVSFKRLQIGVQPNIMLANNPDVRVLNENPICFKLPKMLFDELSLVSDNPTETYKKLIPREDTCFSHVSKNTHFDLFNIFNVKNLHE